MAEGDKVKVDIGSSSFEGKLMPSPELLNRDSVVVKLSSGYNIGISKSKIKKITVVEKHKKKDVSKKEIKFDSKLPTVVLLSFGGTIASKVDYTTGGVSASYDAADYLEMMPELSKIANIRTKSVFAKMSEDYSFSDWSVMAHAIAAELNDTSVTGVVCTQGTDTLHYTTAAISFMLNSVTKPVVFTAAQRSIDRGSTDAFMNLKCAVILASKFDYSGVGVCMHGSSSDDYCIFIRGTKVRKMHTSRRDSFRPINELPICKVNSNGDIDVLNENYSSRCSGKVTVIDKFSDKVGLVYIYPGISSDVFNHYIKSGYKGLIVAGTALGHVPSYVIAKIKECSDSMYVGICSQTLYGSVHEYVYTNLRKLSLGTKAVFLGDMMPEVAYVKLSLMIGCSKIDKMTENVAGELNSSIDPVSFLY